RGSLGLDLAAAVDVTLIDQWPCKIPTGMQGLVIIDGHAHGVLLLGRSSSGLQGLFVLPGLIDADFTGEIFIVAQTSFPPIHIPKGSRIAQLVPLSQLTAVMQKISHLTERGDKGFGSTGGLAMLTVPMTNRPIVDSAWMRGKQRLQLTALLDTGADITIMS
ncbi:POK9 protein, partial [Origma solitaria]|nr:POK9 protein [Origma solitaria]